MSAQHTPGPWKIDETGEFIETEYPVNFRGNYVHICDFRRPMDEESHANARLIAAAPEMLEALRQIGVAADLATIDARHGILRIQKALPLVAAAIAKAEGREP